MAKADAVEVEFSGGERSATRFANSNITANMVQFDRSVSDHGVLRARSRRTATTREFDDASLKQMVERRAEARAEARENAEALPLIRGRRSTSGRRGAAERRQFRPGRARADGQAEHRHLRRRRACSAPATSRRSTRRRCTRELEGTVRLLPVRRGQLHPDLPHAGRRRSGWAGITGVKDIAPDRRGAAHRGGG